MPQPETSSQDSPMQEPAWQRGLSQRPRPEQGVNPNAQKQQEQAQQQRQQ